MSRVFVVWCPDWPVAAAMGEAGVPPRSPAAVFAANRVVAATASARTFGIRRGMRRRDAQSRCPELQVLPAQPDRDARAFEPVLTVLEEIRPGVAVLRPGLAALRSPGQYYGGEEATAAVIAERVVGLGVWDCRVGVADEIFTAEQAARLAEVQGCRVIAPEGGREFLSDLPVEIFDDEATVSLLRRLGIDTLGALAALPAPDVRARFGGQVARVHQVLGGVESSRFAPRAAPADLDAEVRFEPPLESWEAVGFSTRRTVERFVAGLSGQQAVCTEMVIEIGTEDGAVARRTWLHPRWFDSSDILDRLRYQLAPSASETSLRAPVTSVRFEPITVVPEHVHAEGLWGGTDARVERGIARLQGMLGHDRVLAPVLQGGRSPASRQALVPWGERAVGLRETTAPWPGRIPGPSPSRVFRTPWPVQVADAGGGRVRVDARGVLSAEPARIHLEDRWHQVSAWAGPWPIEEFWWEGDPVGEVLRFQIVTADGRAWLITVCDGAWQAVAGYE